MNNIIATTLFTFFVSSQIFAQLNQTWESPTTIGRKGTAYGYDGRQYVYIQDKTSGTLAFYNQEGFLPTYTIENIEADIYPTLIPDLNQNGHSEVLIQNWRTGTLKIQDISTGIILYQWNHTDSIYNWISLNYSGNIFNFIIEKQHKLNGHSSLLFYTTQRPTNMHNTLSEGTPTNFSLGNNYPNPFNPGTTVTYSIQKSGHVQLTIYNTLGESIRRLVDNKVQAGTYSIIWDGKDSKGNEVSSGNYYYKLQFDDSYTTRRMVKLK